MMQSTSNEQLRRSLRVVVPAKGHYRQAIPEPGLVSAQEIKHVYEDSGAKEVRGLVRGCLVIGSAGSLLIILI